MRKENADQKPLESINVFISFAGRPSEYIANKLCDLLSKINGAIRPWKAPESIRSGVWLPELMKGLKSTHIGIVCLDRENARQPWINFEAGALANNLDNELVFPYLNGVDHGDLSDPIAKLQCIKADKAGTLKLLKSICEVLRKYNITCQTDEALVSLFEDLWPNFATLLSEAPAVPLYAGTERRLEDVLSELLEIARMNSIQIGILQRATKSYYNPPIEQSITDNLDIQARLNFYDARRRAFDLRLSGKFEKALEAYKEALAIYPDDLETQIDIAVTQTYLNRPANYEPSITELESLIAKHSASPEADSRDSIIAKAFYNLACIKMISKNETGADYSIETILTDLEEAVKRYPYYTETASRDLDLVALRDETAFIALLKKYSKN